MNNRNVATKEIFSVLDSERGSASDISTQPELSEHSGWQLRGFGRKKQKKNEKQTKRNKTEQQTSEAEQKVVLFFFFFFTQAASEKNMKSGGGKNPSGRHQAASRSASSTLRSALGVVAAHRKRTITDKKNDGIRRQRPRLWDKWCRRETPKCVFFFFLPPSLRPSRHNQNHILQSNISPPSTPCCRTDNNRH